ncbi:MAG: hypothetical protein MK207_13335 [Saprospiraceae bacterium]|nr:hypothetical protein [Saprospiraceae bacterium]
MTGAYQFLKKYGVAIGFGLGTILCLLMYVIILSGYPEFNPTEKELYELSIFDFGLFTTYFLVCLAIILVVAFSGMYVARNPKESVKGLIAFGVLLVLFFISYSMGDGSLTTELVNSDPTLLALDVKFEEGVTQSSGLRFADGMIKFGYIMMLLASLAMLLAAGRDFIKQS